MLSGLSVHLLVLNPWKKKVHRKAAAGLESSQYHFMCPFGLNEPECMFRETDWECPISNETAEIWMTVSRHRFFENIWKKHQNNSLIFDAKLCTIVGVDAE